MFELNKCDGDYHMCPGMYTYNTTCKSSLTFWKLLFQDSSLYNNIYGLNELKFCDYCSLIQLSLIIIFRLNMEFKTYFINWISFVCVLLDSFSPKLGIC